jgi:DNA-binding GntR family transcriptional regulator
MTTASRNLAIRRRYLHDEAADRLRDLVQSGALAPGERVNEAELAERFGISRTPMREAIKILAADGLLETLPNHGARVAQIDAEELDEMIEVVAALEAAGADLACRHVTEAEIAAIAADHAAMVEAWRRRDEASYFARNRAIHDALMAASRNRTLIHLYNTISGRILRARYSAHKTPSQWEKAVREHEAILAQLRARDAAALSTTVRDHVRGKAVVIATAYGLSAAPAADGERPRGA